MTGEATTGGRGNAAVQFYRWVLGIGYERNVGGTERTLRYLLGTLSLVLAAGVAVVPVIAGVANTVLAGVLAVTGVYVVYEARVQYCPMNHTIGRSTYREADGAPSSER